MKAKGQKASRMQDDQVQRASHYTETPSLYGTSLTVNLGHFWPFVIHTGHTQEIADILTRLTTVTYQHLHVCEDSSPTP